MTQPQAPLTSLVSDHYRIEVAQQSVQLICDPVQIFDLNAVAETLAEAVETAKSSKGLRARIVEDLGARQKAGMIAIAKAFEETPAAAHQLTRSYTYLTDCLVQTVWKIAAQWLHPLPNPTEGERLSVIAVGGYGRGEMAPFSDVDLLFLTPYKLTPWAESVIESMLYMLWDLKLKVGHSSRTVKDCLRLGKDDYTIRTAMLENRRVCGDAALSDELNTRLWSDLFSGSEREFIEAKLQERSARHIKQGGQRYVVEPNVKEGKGGLRDLQSLYWIAKYVHHANSAADLVKLGVFRPEEYQKFKRAEGFLWAVRSHLISSQAVRLTS